MVTDNSCFQHPHGVITKTSGTSGMHHCALNRPEQGVPCGTTGMHQFQSTYQKHSNDPAKAESSQPYRVGPLGCTTGALPHWCAQKARRVGPLGCTTQIHSRTEWDHWDAPLSALNRRAEWDHWDAPRSRAPFMSVVQRGSRRPPRTWAVSDSVLLSHRVEPHRCLLNLSEYPHQRAGRRTPTIHVRWDKEIRGATSVHPDGQGG